MTYLLQVSGIWIILFAAYYFGLRGLTFFNHNRLYLLCSLVLGLTVPIIAPMIEINKPEEITFQFNNKITYKHTYITTISEDAAPIINWMDILNMFMLCLYWAGVLFMASRLLIGLYSIYKMYKQGEKVVKENLEFVYNEKAHLPFSFLNKIFLSKTTSFNEEINHIIHHEITHVKQKHTLDVLFIELNHVFFWFNPILIFYKKAMKDAHEYIADNTVVSDDNKTSYINLLFNTNASDLELGLVNSFFNSQLLNRIKMMDTPRSQKSHMIKYLIIVPCLGAFTYLLASAKTDKGFNLPAAITGMLDTIPTSSNIVEATPIKESTSSIAIDEAPQFKGGKQALYNYLASNIKYPASARTEGKEGKAIVSFTVNLDGKVEEAKIIKGINEAINNEALRVVNAMNEKTLGWTPAKLGKDFVKSSFNLPITFLLQRDKNDVTKSNQNDKNPLLVVDGIELDRNSSIDDLDVENIASINILKDPEGATLIYGERGKVAVIYVRTKTPKGVVKNKPLEEVVVVALSLKTNSSVNGLKENKIVTEEELKKDKEISVGLKSEDNILYIVDGLKTKNIQNINPDNIAYMSIHKDAPTISKYGEKGIDQVIIVKTKNKDKDNIQITGIRAPAGSLFIVDGKERKNLDNFDYKTLETIDLIDEKKAIKLYGPKGKNGVVKIETYKVAKTKSSSEEKVYDFVAQKPEFPTGDKALFEYLSKNIKYPETASKNKIEGKVIIKFVVNRDGSIGDAKIVRGIGGGCDEEALRVVNAMPKWIPGKNNGKPVNVTYNLPVSFKLSGDKPNALPTQTNLGIEKSLTPLNTKSGENSDDQIYDFCSEKPYFLAGDKALFEYLTKNTRYTEEAKNNKIEGKVIIKFVVGKDGSIVNPTVVRGIGGGCDEEALRVVRNMPKWIPGKNNGQPVNVIYNLPISFKLANIKTNVADNNLGIVVKENPSLNGKLIFNVSTTDLLTELNINVVDVSGMSLGRSTVKNVKEANTIEMNISNQFNGLLIINVTQGKNANNAKIAVQK
jgi:TonB family protein